MENQFAGGCLCGAVRYLLTAAPNYAYFRTLCGTTAPDGIRCRPEHVSIKACSLDDPSWLEPDRHLFTSRIQPWLKLDDGLMQYERDC